MNKNIFLKTITSPIFITLLLLIINLTISSFGPMNNDEGIWNYIGRAWSLDGIPPYVGTVENKTPGIFELCALSNLLFGINVFFVRGLGIIAVLVSSLTVYFIGKTIQNHLAGVFSMYLFGLTSTWGLANGIFISHTEVFMVMFSTLSFYFVIKSNRSPKWRYWILFAGISMGFAIAFKQIAITTSIALFLFYFYTLPKETKQNKFIGIMLLGLGIIISTFISIFPLLLSSVTIKEYIDGAWLILLNSGSRSSITDHFTEFLNIFVYSRFAFFYPFLFLVFWQRSLLKNHYFVGLFIWLLFDFIGVNSSGYYYGHQIRQLLPSFSIIVGILFSGFLSGLLKHNKNKTTYLISILCIMFCIMLPFKSLSIGIGHLVEKTEINPDKDLGFWLRGNTKKTDYIYLIDYSINSSLVYSEKLSSSKFFNPIFITSDYERNIVFNDLIAKPPAIIVTQNSNEKSKFRIGSKIESWISKHYRFEEIKYGYNIYKKK